MNKKTREKRKIERQRIRLWHRHYEKCIVEAKDKIRGYEQLMNVYGAYIAILLKRLGATEDSAVSIQPKEIADAIEKAEARVTISEDGTYNLYYAEE